MFDGTDLSSAYGSPLLDPMANNVQLPPPAMQMAADPTPSAPQTAPGATSHATPPNVAYNPPAQMYATEPTVANSAFHESFWDKLANKKWDVIKLVILSLVVLLAMSIDRVGNFYLLKYINASLLSSSQEFLVRLSYPIIVLLSMWIIKALS